MTTPQYVYQVVSILRVTDSDTYWVSLDVGFRQQILIDLRLDGFDTPEMSPHTSKYGVAQDVAESFAEQEKQAAQKAKQFATDFLASGNDLWVETEKDPDDFGRWIASVWSEDDDGDRVYLGDELVRMGLATRWPTRWYQTYLIGAKSQGSTQSRP